MQGLGLLYLPLLICSSQSAPLTEQCCYLNNLLLKLMRNPSELEKGSHLC